jgi:hypothetical protein
LASTHSPLICAADATSYVTFPYIALARPSFELATAHQHSQRQVDVVARSANLCQSKPNHWSDLWAWQVAGSSRLVHSCKADVLQKTGPVQEICFFQGSCQWPRCMATLSLVSERYASGSAPCSLNVRSTSTQPLSRTSSFQGNSTPRLAAWGRHVAARSSSKCLACLTLASAGGL